MSAGTETPLLEMQSQVWKARAQAKQKMLERTLAEPAKGPHDTQRRSMWIRRALKAVKRGQDKIKYQTALMDAYAAHLSALEMSLMAAAEQKQSSESSARPQS